MSVINFFVRSIAMFVMGAVSFLVLLVAIAAVICLLLVGFTCALFTVWALVLFLIYLVGHDHGAGYHALQALLIAAACFGAIVLASSTVTDLFTWARRPKLSLAFTEQSDGKAVSRP